MDTTLTHSSCSSFFPRRTVCRLVFTFIFISLLYSSISHTLLHQLQYPVLKFPYVDLTYWVMHLLKIPELLTGNLILAWCFDILLFITCVLSLIFPSKRLFIISFFVLYFIYYLFYNSYGMHYAHSIIG